MLIYNTLSFTSWVADSGAGLAILVAFCQASVNRGPREPRSARHL
jgi:hypothetical protein